MLSEPKASPKADWHPRARCARGRVGLVCSPGVPCRWRLGPPAQLAVQRAAQIFCAGRPTATSCMCVALGTCPNAHSYLAFSVAKDSVMERQERGREVRRTRFAYVQRKHLRFSLTGVKANTYFRVSIFRTTDMISFTVAENAGCSIRLHDDFDDILSHDAARVLRGWPAAGVPGRLFCPGP